MEREWLLLEKGMLEVIEAGVSKLQTFLMSDGPKMEEV
jgi:hypothetical protein